MSRTTARHRAPYRLLKYPLATYIYAWKNRWYCFTKPALLKKLNIIIEYLKGRLK